MNKLQDAISGSLPENDGTQTSAETMNQAAAPAGGDATKN